MPPKFRKPKIPPEEIRPRTRAQKAQAASEFRKRRRHEVPDPLRPQLVDEPSDEDLGPPLFVPPLESMSPSSSFVPPLLLEYRPESISPARSNPSVQEVSNPSVQEVSNQSVQQVPDEKSPAQSPVSKAKTKAKGKSKAKVKSCAKSKKGRASSSKAVPPVEEELSDSNHDDETNGIPPLPEIKVNTKNSKNLPYDISDRKAACQYSRSLLEQDYPGFWDPVVPPFSRKFQFEEAKVKYDQLRKRTFFEERTVLPSHDQNTDLLRLIRRGKLEETVQNMEQYSKEVVLEFYSNFYPDLELAPDISFVFVRGKFYEFSPRMINHVLDLPNPSYQAQKLFDVDVSNHVLLEMLTDGKKGAKWHGFEPRFLIPCLHNLYNICCLNWMPTSNTTYVTEKRAKLCYKIWKRKDFNLGKIIYDQIAKIAMKPRFGEVRRKKLLPFPSLISKVLEFQRSVPLKKSDFKEVGPKEFKAESYSDHEDIPTASSSEHKLGVSMEADFNHVMSILQTMAEHYAGSSFSVYVNILYCFYFLTNIVNQAGGDYDRNRN